MGVFHGQGTLAYKTTAFGDLKFSVKLVGLRVEGLGNGAEGLESGVWGLRFDVWGFRVGFRLGFSSWLTG